MMRKVKKMLVLCPFPVGVAAGQRLKYEQYFPDWRERGYEITVSSFMDDALWRIVYEPGQILHKLAGTLRGLLRRFHDLIRVSDYDVVYVFMWVTPFGSTIFEKLVRLRARSLVYDIEDNVLEKQVNALNPLKRFLGGGAKAPFLIRKADHVITSSPTLNATCLGINAKKRCTFISSSVDIDRFVPVNTYSNDRKLTIGWTGTFSSKEYLDLLREIFVELATRNDFCLRVIGNFDYDLPGVNVEVMRWSEATEVRDLQGIDIGVYPLPINDWVLGKSGLKAIQYMAFGIPTVATAVGTAAQIIRDKENGLLVRSHEEWIAALELLITSPGLRRRLGVAARQTIIERFSIDATKSAYAKVLTKIEDQFHDT